METIKSWFEERILSLELVKKNLKNAYATGKAEGNSSGSVDEKNNEILSLIRRIEELKSSEHEVEEALISKSVDEKLNKMLSVVDYNHIISLDKRVGAILIGGNRADDIQLKNLKAEAEFLLQSSIWKLLQETPKELAQRAMFVDSESLVDIQKGKSILYTLSAQKNIVELLKSVGEKK